MKHGLATAIVAILAATALAAAAGQIKVTPVVTTEGRVLASFSATDAWTIEIRELLQFGQAVNFDYFVELRRPAMFVDAQLAKTNVTASAKLDTLTGNYQVSRYRDRRVLRSEKIGQESDVRDWLTVFENVELEPESPLKANVDYYILVRLSINPRRSVSLWSLLPFSRDDSSGRAPFTYIR